MNTFFIRTYRSQKELLAVLHHEISEDITVSPWREDEAAKGFYYMDLPENVNFYDTYELFKFLQFHVTYINVPVQFYVSREQGFGKVVQVLHKEPLCSWKTIDPEFILEPVPVDKMTQQISDRMGLSPIIRVETQRMKTPPGLAEREKRKVEKTLLFDIGSERKDKETVMEITVTYTPNEEDANEKILSQLRIEMTAFMKGRNLQWVFARLLGKDKIHTQLTREDLTVK